MDIVKHFKIITDFFISSSWRQTQYNLEQNTVLQVNTYMSTNLYWHKMIKIHFRKSILFFSFIISLNDCITVYFQLINCILASMLLWNVNHYNITMLFILKQKRNTWLANTCINWISELNAIDTDIHIYDYCLKTDNWILYFSPYNL